MMHMTAVGALVLAGAAPPLFAQQQCQPQQQGLVLLIIDDETIDPGISSIEQAADDCGVDAAVLVNDNDPVEEGNPPLYWNVNCPGGEYWLPTGQLEDEGLFAPGPDTGLDLSDYIAGTISQDELDEIPDINPLGNAQIQMLVGKSFVGVVYDSDVSLNVEDEEFIANLKGARYGLFFFTVLDTRPSEFDEDGLLDILVHVNPVPGDFCWKLLGDDDCAADCNGDGSLNILDFVCFQGLFQNGDPAADCNADANLNILDFVCFQGAFQMGCD